LHDIIERLANRPESLNKDAFWDIADALMDDGWSLARVLAHLDIVDLEERI
tara:strand:+ start:3983 stop:4135 length:153 start_codon:yes stop_codon:yes gene_type:complete